MIFAIDPGTRTSGTVLFDPDTGAVREANPRHPNDDLLDLLRNRWTWDTQEATAGAPIVAIEQFKAAGGGHGIGGDSVHTIQWTGRFQEAAHPLRVRLVTRLEVLRHLGIAANARNKDGHVIDRCCDLYGGPPRAAAKGTKKQPGPLYGMSSHAWQALGVALTVAGVK